MDISRELALKKKREESFERWYSLALHSQRIPLEFAGQQAKELLKEAYSAGEGYALVAMLTMMLLPKEGK